MIKVVLADDEIRICQLIQALIDWESLGMEVVGVAHNGIEAIEQVRTHRPDILITDIRMPGCSGLDLIEQVKADTDSRLEIIIISGYAHFEYAQQAIKFGVGDYLLKPINKAELTGTLEKLQNRVKTQRASSLSEENLRKKSESDTRLLQETLMESLLKPEAPVLSEALLRDTYGLAVQPGLYCGFCVKLDCGCEELSDTSLGMLLDKAREILTRLLSGKCHVFLLQVGGFACNGLVNLDAARKEDLRRALRSAVNQLELQKSLFRPVSFTIALGPFCKEAKDLPASMREASLLLEERLLHGSGRVFERLGEPSAIGRSGVLDRCLHGMGHALEVHSPEFLDDTLHLFQKEVLDIRDLRGHELKEAVRAAAEMYAVRAKLADRTRALAELRARLDRFDHADGVFETLTAWAVADLKRQVTQLENDSTRPIRKAKQYIQTHYAEPITQEEVSAAVGLTATYFSTLFKKTEGEGFAKYLIRVRMDRAKLLLRESNASVADICRKVGYNDLKHFTHTFEKATGVKPSVYRKLYG